MIKNMECFGTEEENNYFSARKIIIADHLITYEIVRYYFLSLLCVIAFLLQNARTVDAQTVVTTYRESTFEQRNHDIRFSVIDSLTLEPIEFASAYLIPHGDTIITHFTISAKNGEVQFSNVMKGRYWLNVEILGYNSFRQEYAINSDNAVPKEIKLSECKDFIDAATITGLADPIRQVKDTIIYNATAFKVGNDAMLEELLKTMPGIEINNGSVTVNGKQVTEITVNGRTFFFGDMSVALKNLPAKIIDKIKVIDRASKESESSGMRTATTDERVMDVVLDAEFSKGAFGNMNLGGGAAWDKSPEDEDSAVKSIYLAKVFSSIYGKKDQMTILADANNMTVGNGYGTKAGVSWSTDRLEKIDANVSVIGSYGRMRSDNSSNLSYYNVGSSLDKLSKTSSKSNQGKIAAFIDVHNKNSDIIDFELKPEFSVSKSKLGNVSSGKTDYYSMSDDRSGTSDDLKTNGRLSFDVKKLGKAGRAINIYSKYDLSESRDFLDRISDMHYAKSDVLERLKYDMRYRAFMVSARFAYTEPIATKWSLFFSETFRYDFSGNKTLAREKLTEIVRDDLSSDSNINNYRLTENLLIKYRNKISLHVGASVEHLKTTNSLWQVISSQRMENRFVTNVSPYVHIQFHSQSQYVQFYVGADAIPISSMEVFPAVVKLTPSDMQTGNIFLHQPYANEFNFSYTRRADKITCDFTLLSSIQKNPVVYANWFDKSGVRNSFPVNSKKPSANIYLNYTIWSYLDKKKQLFFQTSGTGQYKLQSGYQSLMELDGLGDTSFDYALFLSKIYGGASGEKFYNGESGFKESRTNIIDANAFVYALYRTGALSVNLKIGANYYGSRYSLVKKANKDVFVLYATPAFSYEFPYGFSIDTECEYKIYRGYGDNYDRELYDWSVAVGKRFKMVSIALTVNDLLNQSVNFTHSASAEYYQTVLSRSLGRRITLTLSYNFGKGSNKQKRAADRFASDSEQY